MSYSPVNPYVPLPPNGANAPMGGNPQSYGYSGTGYPQNVAAPAAAPAVNAANLMPPDSLNGPAQNANLASAGELDRETTLDEVATTRAGILNQRLMTRANINSQIQGTVMGVVAEDMDISNTLIGNGEKFGKDSLNNAKAAAQ